MLGCVRRGGRGREQSETDHLLYSCRFQDSKEDNKLEQTYLDLGQKNFGLVECEECKLVYNVHVMKEGNRWRRGRREEREKGGEKGARESVALITGRKKGEDKGSKQRDN